MNVKKIIKKNFGGGGRLTRIFPFFFSTTMFVTRISPIRLRLEYVISRLSKFLDAFITPSRSFVNTKKTDTIMAHPILLYGRTRLS